MLRERKADIASAFFFFSARTALCSSAAILVMSFGRIGRPTGDCAAML